MILSGNTILEYVQQGLISVQPYFDAKQLRPVGLRVHLGNEVLVPEPGQRFDLSNSRIEEPRFNKLSLLTTNLVVHPGDFILASTAEAIRLHPALVCRLDGRSTLARMGLLIHCTSETVDNIHLSHRSIVLEIVNVGSFEIVIPRMYAIGMLIFETLSSPADSIYEQSQYEGQMGVAPPNLIFDIPKYGEEK